MYRLLLCCLASILSAVDCSSVCPIQIPGLPVLPLGRIDPTNAYLVYGSNVNLTCDKHCYTGAGNSSLMGFKFLSHGVLKRVYYPGDPQLTIVNETAIALELTNVTLASKGAYSCIMLSSVTNDTTYVQTVVVNNIGLPPGKAELSCVVMNYLNMECTAEMTDTLLNTVVTMEYKVIARPTYDPCPRFNKKTLTCYWYSNSLAPCPTDKAVLVEQTYDIKVTATNVLGTATRVSRLYLRNFVKPDPVTNLQIVNKGSRNVTLAFDLDSIVYTKPHRVDAHYTSKFHSGIVTKMLTIASRHWTIDLHDLRPHVTYTVSVVLWPYNLDRQNVTGFASNPVSVEVTTLADVPETSPKLLPGSYTQTDCGMSCHSRCPVDPSLCREVRVFWPKVTEEDRNGDITGYHIRVNPTLDVPKYVTAGSSQSETLVMLKNETYTVEIEAENAAGLARTSSNITILSTDQGGVVAPAYVAAYRSLSESQTVLVKWSVDGYGGDDGEYIIYYSDSDIKDRWSKPKTDVFSMIVPGAVREENITLPSGHQPDDYWFGVTRVLRSGDSSPMVVSECVYKPDNGLVAPTLTKMSTYPDYTIGVNMKALRCDETNDVVVNYTIFYCPTDVTVGEVSEADCTGPKQSTTVNVTTTEVLITNGAVADQMYLVSATTQTPSARSEESQPIRVRVSGLTTGHIIGIVIATVLFAFFIVVAIVICLRKCCQTVKKELDDVKFEFPCESLDGYIVNTVSNSDYDFARSSSNREPSANTAGKTKEEIRLQVVSEPSGSGLQSVSSGSVNYSKLAVANVADASQEGHAGQEGRVGHVGNGSVLPSIGEVDVESGGSSGGYEYKQLAIRTTPFTRPVTMDTSGGSYGDSSESYQRVCHLVGSSDQGMGSSTSAGSSEVDSYSKIGMTNGALKNGLVHPSFDSQGDDSEHGDSGSSVTPILA